MEEESFPMTGGHGANNYANNSNRQKEGAYRAQAALIEAIIENLEVEEETPTSTTFQIADLGYSTGPNTFFAVNTIIEAVTHKFKLKGHSSLLDFQVHLSDHVLNDFNTLFKNLPSGRQYFASGVPGSFHGRLFPKASLDFVYSAYAVQWLSRIPQQLDDPNSPAYNPGRIYYSGAPDEVGKAYAAQYAKDMECFLQARAQEVVPGGLMALLIPGRPDEKLPSESSLGPLFQPLESSLLDMSNEEIIGKDKMDSFNLPIYSPSPDELRTLINKKGRFSIARLESSELTEKSRKLPTTHEFRAGFQNIIAKHFGNEIVEQLFQRFAKKFEGRPDPAPAPNEALVIGLFVLLKRNAF
ncbi:hypothetical protein PTKIN_Ptkin04bG0107500 [Pterospermum kingtungense]